jgi:serine/threonine protein kinase
MIRGATMSAQFGPYRLAAVLSRGPSATVYRAHDTSHDDRVVALKVFGPELSANPAFRERFRRDAGRLSALREPHVVPIHRHGEIDGRLFLDMRLVRGPSLADVLRDGPLAPPRAAAIAGQIGAAAESLRAGGLGGRPLERADILLTGPPGRGEFERGSIVLRDVDTGRPLGAPLTGHEAALTALGVADLNGRPILVSGARDNTIRVWDLAVRAAG